MGKAIICNLGKSRSFGRLSLKAKVLWPMLLVAADDQGRGDAAPDAVKWYICPNVDEITQDDVPGLLGKMEEQGMVCIYEDDTGEPLFQIVKWWQYQNPQWAQESQYPPPDSWTDRIRKNIRGGKYQVENWEHPGGFAAPEAAEEPAENPGGKPGGKPGGPTREEKRREAKRKEGSKGADAPPELPHHLDGWLDFIQDGKRKPGGMIARVGRMLITLWPRRYDGRDPPYAKIGGVGRNVGGPSRLAHLLWQANAYKVTGDPLEYCSKMHTRGNNGNNRKGSRKGQSRRYSESDLLNPEEARRQLAEEGYADDEIAAIIDG